MLLLSSFNRDVREGLALFTPRGSFSFDKIESNNLARTPASIKSADEDPILRKVRNDISAEENARGLIQYRTLAYLRTQEWIQKYSSKRAQQRIGSYSLIHMDKLYAISRFGYKGSSLKDEYHYAILEGNQPNRTQVYLDPNQDRLVLLTGRASLKSNSKTVLLPQGAKTIFTSKDSGIVHVQFRPGADPVVELAALQSLNKNLEWSQLEIIDRMELPE